MYTFNGMQAYPDARDDVMTMGIGTMGAIGGLAYVPDLGPVGSGSQGTYYPRSTAGDMQALAYLGFVPPAIAAMHVGTYGSRAADSSAGVGAWSDDFQYGLKNFQRSVGLDDDGWIGPASRTALAASVARKNATDPGPIPIPPSPIPIPPSPNVLPGPFPPPTPGPGPTPVVAKEEGMPLTTKIAIGAGIAALLAGGYYALK